MAETEQEYRLLELAAKAYGLTEWSRYSWYGVEYNDLWAKDADGKYGRWNPLTNDGDALRLAMKLAAEGKLKLIADGMNVSCFYNDAGLFVPYTFEVDHENPTAAFRYAVTGAAAEIGRTMK